MEQNIILVNENDEEIGYGEKMAVHKAAQLHRAFSIFVLNSKNELMLQKRAHHKYHSGGLWTNTCCSHPLKGEDQEITIHNRLVEEMGFDTSLKKLFYFTYKAELENGLTEYELDHVYLGRFEGEPKPNPEEVCDWKWMDIEEFKTDLKDNPQNYTYWVNYAFEEFYSYYKNEKM